MKTVIGWSGGGANGPWQQGVAIALLDRGIIKLEDVVAHTGISVGNLIGYIWATGNPHLMTEIFMNVANNRDVYKGSAKLRRVIWQLTRGKDYLFDTEPLRKLIEEYTRSIELKTDFVCGWVNMYSGQYATFDTRRDAITVDNVRRALYDSAAFPIAFKPGDVKNIDGGLRTRSPLSEAVTFNADRIILINSAPREIGYWDKKPNLVNSAGRVIDIMSHQILIDDIEQFEEYNHVAQLRGGSFTSSRGKLIKKFESLIIFPPEKVGSSLDFSQNKEKYEAGYEYGKNLEI
jgi:predicted acylesterase/phospholipase RssA